MYKYNVQEGYYARKVTVITDRALKDHTSAQAGVIVQKNGDELLMSYNTPVALFKLDGTIECYFIDTATTRKHIGYFAKEHGLTYFDFKAAYLSR